jgi:23S rRNA (cytidine1920-2'-O)/16S rRNA (cytidine1409-2'-O)-methyltransferase
MEQTNIRYLTPADLGEPLDLSVIDVSFISLSLVLPAVTELLKPGKGQILCLIKPQFEAGKENIGKKGVVKDPAVHRTVLRDVIDSVTENGFTVKGLTHSPIVGPEGNLEFLLWFSNAGTESLPNINEVVRQAHQENTRG